MAAPKAQHRSVDDTELALVQRASDGDAQAVRAIIRENNQRLYRLVRAVLRSSLDAEEALQETYLHAFSHLSAFNGEASLATWLSRIALNTAFMRLRSLKTLKRIGPSPGSVEAEVIPFPSPAATVDPERTMAQRQLLQLVEEATDALPEDFRVVFMARVIEGLSVEETAELLDVAPATIKTRLHRARKLIRERLEERIGPVLMDAFPFAGSRCERLTEAVIGKLGMRDGREPL